MVEDRLARLRASQEIHKWREVWREDRHDPSDPDNYYAPSIAVCDELSAIRFNFSGLVITRPIAELESVLADPPQDDEEAMEAFKAWPRIVELANEVAELKAKLAAPTPADGAPQEQEP